MVPTDCGPARRQRVRGPGASPDRLPRVTGLRPAWIQSPDHHLSASSPGAGRRFRFRCAPHLPMQWQASASCQPHRAPPRQRRGHPQNRQAVRHYPALQNSQWPRFRRYGPPAGGRADRRDQVPDRSAGCIQLPGLKAPAPVWWARGGVPCQALQTGQASSARHRHQTVHMKRYPLYQRHCRQLHHHRVFAAWQSATTPRRQ